MNRRAGFGGFWTVFIFIMIFSSTGALLPILFSAAVIYLIYSAIKSANKNNQSDYTGYRYGHATRTRAAARSEQELSDINAYLKRYFFNKRIMELNDNIDLVLHGASFTDMSALDVYRDGRRLTTMDGFRKRYENLYESVMDTLSAMAKKDGFANRSSVVDAEVVHPEDAVKEEKAEETKKPEESTVKGAQYFIDTINSLNSDIPDEEISNGLYQSSQLLTQIQKYEQKFPDSRNKLDKLYTYYLPILIRILEQYSNLQYVKSDPSYDETQSNLKRTLKLVNEAMTKIISGLTDNDFINLSADISTLEAVLKKDGLTDGDVLSQKGSKEGKAS
ncbi:MAG: hypothetical protein EOM64_03135 [Erysipelotrichia bacterium]|nr:hypothetical protein [Erysipelotrichia bacterium]